MKSNALAFRKSLFAFVEAGSKFRTPLLMGCLGIVAWDLGPTSFGAEGIALEEDCFFKFC